MNNNQTMISAAMLEAVWQSRKKDMIDLITPFVMYATATLTSPGEKVDIQKVQNYEASCMIVETHPGCQAPACSAYRF